MYDLEKFRASGDIDARNFKLRNMILKLNFFKNLA
jgi:hypothetical protein